MVEVLHTLFTSRNYYTTTTNNLGGQNNCKELLQLCPQQLLPKLELWASLGGRPPEKQQSEALGRELRGGA